MAFSFLQTQPMNNISFSIITCSYNSNKNIEQTIQSVISQTFKEKEYIIIDGGSDDGTVDIIKKYNEDITLWVSEPDQGISDAMNKGLQLASNNYIIFLHSDDYLINSMVLEQIASYIDGRTDLYFFQVLLDNLEDKKLSTSRPLGWWTNFKMGSCHQGHICARKMFTEIGGFNTDFKIVMDYDFILRAYRTGVRSRVVKCPLAVMRLTGISSQKNWESLQNRFNEERRVHFRNCPSISMQLIYLIYWMVYLPYRKILHLASR